MALGDALAKYREAKKLGDLDQVLAVNAAAAAMAEAIEEHIVGEAAKAGQSVITTLNDLDALPRGSVIVASDEAWNKRAPGWSSCFDNHAPYSRTDLLPAKLIWRPAI